jgi:3-hydroxyisobutyrate dehydrogenase-like beta-hydroxyacid dehydrogenase
MTRVAVIGLGAMGGRIARRFLDADHEVVVWNRTPSKTVELADLGAGVAASPAEAARRADAIVIMVSDETALRDVTEGPEGIAGGVEDSPTVIQMSTVGLEPVARLASVLPSGTGLLDAPVLGSISEVEAGSLRIFVGGSVSLAERCIPLLSVLGSPMHVGPLGAGSAAKLVANSTLFGVLGLLGEALALADRLELPHDVAFEVLAATPLAAQAERRRPSIQTGEYPLRFSLSLAVKDVDLILDAAVAKGADLRLAAAARTWFADAETAGWGDRDYSAVLAHILRSGA